jgi:hypothetical protein
MTDVAVVLALLLLVGSGALVWLRNSRARFLADRPVRTSPVRHRWHSDET